MIASFTISNGQVESTEGLTYEDLADLRETVTVLADMEAEESE